MVTVSIKLETIGVELQRAINIRRNNAALEHNREQDERYIAYLTRAVKDNPDLIPVLEHYKHKAQS